MSEMESSPKRKGYRNGSYSRDLLTSTGCIEDLKGPRDREGHFHTQVFERYRRYEPHVAEGLTQMFVAGVSTHKVREVAQTLMGIAPSASAISRLNQTLTQQFEAWRERPLEQHWRILYLDGVHFSIRDGIHQASCDLLKHLRSMVQSPCHFCEKRGRKMADLTLRSFYLILRNRSEVH